MDTLGSYGRERALYARRRSNCYLLETSMEGRKSPMGSSEVTLSNQLAENNSSMGEREFQPTRYLYHLPQYLHVW